MNNKEDNHAINNDIALCRLSKTFGQRCVLNEFSMTIASGRTTALMAASGSGKTTLLRILMGLETPDSGRIEGLHGKKISCVFQEDRLCENLSPLSNVRLTCMHPKKKVLNLLTALSLSDCLTQPVRTLSGGERRRIALARALLADYDLLLLDEPFKGLDASLHTIVMRQTALYTSGRTVLLVTHNADEAAFFSASICRF